MPEVIMDGALPAVAPAGAYKDEEVVAPVGAGEITPFKNSKITKLGATQFDQWYTSSCVFHAFLTALEYEGIITKDELKSQLAAYRKRMNYPNEGSIAYDAWDKLREGVLAYDKAPTAKGMTEIAANAMKIIKGDPVLKDRFNYFDITDYSKIPSYVAAGKAIPVFIFATRDEWSEEYVDIKEPNLSILDAKVRHAVVEIPKGDFTEKGVARLSTHDSSKFGNRFLRHVSNDFLQKRCYYAARIEKKVAPVPTPVPPVVKPLVPCEFNQKGEAVKNLQLFLIENKYLQPQYGTGFYGVLTAKAVLHWQLERWNNFTGGVPQLLDYGGKYWGKESIAIIQ